VLVTVVQEEQVRPEVDRGASALRAPFRDDDRHTRQFSRHRDGLVAPFIRADERPVPP
jgi:hypothetical protein